MLELELGLGLVLVLALALRAGKAPSAASGTAGHALRATFGQTAPNVDRANTSIDGH